jgi:hypothetical protein
VSPILWSSKRQPTVSLFSTQAEYCSLTNATKEMIWFQILLLEVHLLDNHPMITTCDNQSMIKLVSNPMFHVRKNTLKSITITFGSMCMPEIWKLCTCLQPFNKPKPLGITRFKELMKLVTLVHFSTFTVFH